MFGLALDFAFYSFLFIILCGLILGVWFIRWIFSGRDPLWIFPHASTPSSKAVKTAKWLIDQAQNTNPTSESAQELEAKLSSMIAFWHDLSERFRQEQHRYGKLCKQREGVWYQIDLFVRNLRWWQKLLGKERQPEYQTLKKTYGDLEQKIEEEYQHLKVFDQILYQELQHHPSFQHHWTLLERGISQES